MPFKNSRRVLSQRWTRCNRPSLARPLQMPRLLPGTCGPKPRLRKTQRLRPENGQTKTVSYIQAVNEALSRELATRPEVLVYGEDVGQAGGIFGASRGLQKSFGADRVFDTPISESAILGSAVGAALMGMKPIVEIMWGDFMLVALDQIINQAANVRYITGGRSGAPIVVRTQQGATPGSCAQHSQCLEALLAHIPRLRIAIPATPQDAYSLLRAAIACPDPCIVYEARGLYQTTGEVHFTDVIEPIGKSRLHKPGRDAVIITWGTMVPVALEAARQLGEEGVDVGVLDFAGFVLWMMTGCALLSGARRAGSSSCTRPIARVDSARKWWHGCTSFSSTTWVSTLPGSPLPT